MSGATNSIQRYQTEFYRDAITRPSNTTQYTAGDVISEVTTNDHLNFGSASDDNSKDTGRPGVGTMTINAATIWSSANQSTKPTFELWLFHTDIANVADNAAFAPTDAEMLTKIAVIEFPASRWMVGTSTSGAGGNSLCEIRNIDMPVRCRRGRVYGQLVDRSGYTPVADEIFTVELACSLD